MLLGIKINSPIKIFLYKDMYLAVFACVENPSRSYS